MDSTKANTYKVIVNGAQAGIKVYFKLSIDWDNNGSFEDTYIGNGTTSSPDILDVSVNTPAGFSGGIVNYRVVAQTSQSKLDDAAMGGGEIEDYQVVTTTPVPVTWLYFTAEKINSNDVILDWSTASELNNSGFEVYKSFDRGVSFEQIGFVDGQGTTTEVSTCLYVDSDANAVDVG